MKRFRFKGKRLGKADKKYLQAYQGWQRKCQMLAKLIKEAVLNRCCRQADEHKLKLVRANKGNNTLSAGISINY